MILYKKLKSHHLYSFTQEVLKRKEREDFMKKLFILVFSMTVLAFIPKLNAETYTEYDEITGLSKEKVVEGDEMPGHITEEEKNFENYINATLNNTLQPRYFTTQMNVTPIKQVRDNYCGYAAVEEILTYLNKSSMSQEQMAASLGRTGLALGINDMTNILNNNTNKNYILRTIGNISEELLINTIKVAIYKNKPIVVMASTKSLELYKNQKNLIHYIVLTGYTRSADSNWNERVIYVDSWDNYGKGDTFGTHVDTRQNIIGTIKGDTSPNVVF